MGKPSEDKPSPPRSGQERGRRPLTGKWRAARRLLALPDADAERAAPVEVFFGPLELKVLESLWNGKPDATVRDLQGEFDGTAYTTLMTTLDRLYKKGVLDRRKEGRAYAYSARFSRPELEAYLAQGAFEALLDGGTRAALRPLLSTFVEAVSQKDGELLDDLEAMVRDERSRRDQARGGDGKDRGR